MTDIFWIALAWVATMIWSAVLVAAPLGQGMIEFGVIVSVYWAGRHAFLRWLWLTVLVAYVVRIILMQPTGSMETAMVFGVASVHFFTGRREHLGAGAFGVMCAVAVLVYRGFLALLVVVQSGSTGLAMVDWGSLMLSVLFTTVAAIVLFPLMTRVERRVNVNERRRHLQWL